jgi:transcriptional regulator with XRE-family HTH domain
MNNNKTFSELLKTTNWHQRIEILRVMRGLSQKETAEQIGTSTRIYQNWEAGRFVPRRLSRKAIANFYGLPENEIFNDTKGA